MASNRGTERDAPVVGYADRLTARPGDRVAFHIGALAEAASYRADIVRLRCADLQPDGAPFSEFVVESEIAGEYSASVQRIDRGSRAVVQDLPLLGGFSVYASVWPTRPVGRRQSLVGTWDEADRSGFALGIDEEGVPSLFVGDGEGGVVRVRGVAPLPERRWSRIVASYDPTTGRTIIAQQMHPASATEAFGLDLEVAVRSVGQVAPVASPRPLVLAACRAGVDTRGTIYGAHYDGKLESPRIVRGALDEEGLLALADAAHPDGVSVDVVGWWDFAREMDGRRIVDISGNGLDGQLENLPVRAMTGSTWEGTEFDWRHASSQYGAIHFHSDDLYDAGWETAFELTVPACWKSGVYAARLESSGATDYVPFFVCPPKGIAKSKLALLAPTATYLAYANMVDPHAIMRSVASGDANVLDRLDGPAEFGPSCYQHHADASGVHHSSHHRPVANLKPRRDLWAFNADTLIADWLEARNLDYDLITDDLLHQEGAELLDGYRAVVTGTHPEYYSTAMRDAIEAYLGAGGRLFYSGANGFYWRIAFSEAWPGAIELRRAEDGTRAWESKPGEYHHAWGGELGGLWRRIGRPPNDLVGVGFVAQGFLQSSSYERTRDSADARAAFAFEGVSAKTFGGFGRLGGAAGEEIDRADAALGTPAHALVLATARDFGMDMMKTKEEFLVTLPPFPEDPDVRADMVFFETPGGGAVFSTGSIAWAGSLAHAGYENDVSRISENVIRRFLDPEPFVPPGGTNRTTT